MAAEVIYDIGRKMSLPGLFKVEIPLSNPNSLPESLEASQGSCSCFMSASLPDGKLAPHGSGNLVLTFHREEMGLGVMEKDVLLTLHGASSHQMLVRVRGSMYQRFDRPGELAVNWFPTRIDFGRVDDRGIEVPVQITMKIPRDVSIQSVNSGMPFVSLKSGNDQKADSQSPLSVTLKYFASVAGGAHKGSFSSEIDFKTDSADIGIISIPIKGEIR